jgi:hypothetical protein
MTTINMVSLDIAWDESSALLYAVVLGIDPHYPNSIVAINPATGDVVQSQNVGSDPYLVRTSTDGSYIYTGYMSKNAVTQLTLPALGSPFTWSLGSNQLDGPLIAIDLQLAPGASETAAVSSGTIDQANNYIFPVEANAYGYLTIYDNGIARPDSLTGLSTTLNAFGSLQWGADSSTLYAANNEITTFDLYAIGVNSSGATLIQDYPGVVYNPVVGEDQFTQIWNFYANIHYDNGTGYLYDDNGLVIDPATGNQIGAYNSFGMTAPDSSLDRVFIFGKTLAQIGPNGDYTINSFDQKLMTPINSITLTGIVGTPMAFIRWGASGLALVTFNEPLSNFPGPPGLIYILNNSSFVSASMPAEHSAFEPVQRTWRRPHQSVPSDTATQNQTR